MKFILEKLWALFEPFVTGMTNVVNFVMGPFIVFFTGIYKAMTWVIERFTWIKAKLAAGYTILNILKDLVGGNLYNALGAFGQTVAFINSVLPITELLVYGTLIVGAYMIAAVIRHVKGWIPGY